MSDSFGRRLRAERERRKISLASIAADTKISARLLEQLERDDLSRWPVGIFKRSFIRAYAEAIGLNADTVVRECLSLFPDPADVRAAETREVDDAPEPALRLTLASSWSPFAGGRLVSHVQKRWAAAAWDAGILIGISVVLFLAFGRFWAPLGVSSLCYYLGGIVVLGNTPGVCLFGPAADRDPDSAPDRPRRRLRNHPAPTKPAGVVNRHHNRWTSLRRA